MFYGNKVQDTRPAFFLSWQKYRAQQVLTPLEQQIAHVILVHPEYHSFFEQPLSQNVDKAIYASFQGENPFLHLGLHLALRDQIATDRPLGVSALFHQLVGEQVDFLEVEHRMIAVLSQCLWQAQQQGSFSEEGYLAELRRLGGDKTHPNDDGLSTL